MSCNFAASVSPLNVYDFCLFNQMLISKIELIAANSVVVFQQQNQLLVFILLLCSRWSPACILHRTDAALSF